MGVKMLVGASWRAGLMARVSAAALLTCTVMAPDAVLAQSSEPSAASEQRMIAFNIPSQDLNGALLSFARTAGVQVFYDADSVKGLRSAELNGTFSVQQGLARLLSSSGLTWQMSGSNTVTLRSPVKAGDGAMTLDPVQVEGTAASVPAQAEIAVPPAPYAGGQVARGGKLGVLGNRDIMDTPFNVTSYTAELIENQQARTIADVLENDPSVRFTTSNGHVQENFTIRGFDVTADEMSLNGLYGMAPDGHVPVEFLERVEVLKGPNALLTGMAPSGGVGGAVNLVPKRAEDTPVTRVTFDYTSDMQLGTHLDYGRRFGTDDRVGIRINTVYRNGETTLDDQSKERRLGTLALDYRGDDLRLSLDAYGMHETNDGGSPLDVSFASSVTSLPTAPDATTNLFKGLDGEQNNYGAVVRGEYDLNRNVTAYAAFGMRANDYSGLITSTHATSTTGSGNTTMYLVNQDGYSDARTAEAGVRGRFATGVIGHEVVFGANTLNLESGRAYTRRAVTGNIYSSSSFSFTSSPSAPLKTAETTLSSVVLADTLSALDDRAQLTLGVRNQSIVSKGYNSSTGAQTSNYDDSAVTPAIGVVIKPFPVPVSLYANYIEGLTKGSSVTDTSASNYGEVFAPYKTKQKEVGVKWDAGRIGNTLSLFEITKPTLSSNSTTSTYTQSDQTNKGVEWNVFGQITESVRVLGGVTYTQSELKKTANGQYDGNSAYGVPEWTGNLGLEWDTPWVPGLTLDGRAVYTGEQYANSTNTLTIPDWWRFDMGARYAFTVRQQNVVVRANVINVLDKNYWAGSFSDGYVTLGTPRTFMLSTSFDF